MQPTLKSSVYGVVIFSFILLGASCGKKTTTNINSLVRVPVLKLFEESGASLVKKKLTYTAPLLVCDTPPCDQFVEPISGKISKDNTIPLPTDTNVDIQRMTVSIEGYEPFIVGNVGLRRPNGDWEIRLNKKTDAD